MERRLAFALAVVLAACGGKDRKGEEDTAVDTPDEDTVEDGDASDVVEEDGTGALSLEVGEVVDLEGPDGLFEFSLQAPDETAGGGRYALVIFASHEEFGGVYSYTASMTAGAGGSPEPDRAVGHGGWIPPHVPPASWQGLIDQLEGEAIPLWETYPPDAPPTAGEVRSFQIHDSSGTLQTISAECQIVDTEIAIWFDITSTPATSVSNLDEIAQLYRDIVMPRERIFFGPESDYNEDGVVHMLFSPLVADIATAYFYPCDLIEDPGSFLGCEYGNHAEMLYVSPPDLLDPYMATPMAMAETMAHETAHMVYFHRKFLLNGQPGANENIYLNEALAALAQDLTGLTGGNFFVTRYGLDEIETFRSLDILTPGGGYDPARDGSLRGQSYMFLRYLYDQAGGETVQTDGSFVDDGGIAWLNDYVDSVDLGEENIEALMGRDHLEILFDFLTALVMSNRGPDHAPISDNPAFNFLPTQTDPLTDRTRGLDMFGTFRDMFSLTGPATASIALNDGTIYSTGVQYLLFNAEDLVDVSLQIDADALARVRIGRIE